MVPGIVTILVGVNPASRSYVRSKDNTARDLGFKLCQEALPADVTDEQIMALIDRYNHDPTIHGVVIQMPLPKHLNEDKVLMAIDPNKDVDGFHPVNYGKLLSGRPSFLPCTAYTIQELLLRSGKPIPGAEIVVVGRSNIAGKPIAAMLMQNAMGNATVTVCHTGTKDLSAHTRRADVVIAAIGVPNYITGDMIKDGAVVIDLGINEVGKTANGKRILTGDVNFDECVLKASAITPVPGGVGPMIITMVMKNTLEAAKAAEVSAARL